MGHDDYGSRLYASGAETGDKAYGTCCGVMTGFVAASRAVGIIAVYNLFMMTLEYIKSNPDLIYQCARL